MRRRYLARIRSFVTVANVAAALGLAVFLGFALATQLASTPSAPPPSALGERGVRRLDFARGIARAAPSGDAVFVRTTTGAALFDLEGQLLARYQGSIAGFAWLADGSGVLLREGDPTRPSDALPLVVLELDGHVTRLPADVPAAAVAGAHISPDGRWIAVQVRDVLVMDRDGARVQMLEGGMLLGWDARGRVVRRDGESLSFSALDGARGAVTLPPALSGAPVARLAGGSAVLLEGAGALWLATEAAVRQLPADCLPLWLRPNAVLCAAAPAYSLDLASGARRDLAVALDAAAKAGARAAVEDVLLWVDGAAAVHALDLLSGVDRVIPGVPGEAAFEALPDGLFVANDSHDTYLIAARER